MGDDLAKYEPSRRDGASISPSLPEKSEGLSFTAPKSPLSGCAAHPLPRPPSINGSTSSFGSTSPGIPEPQPYPPPPPSSSSYTSSSSATSSPHPYTTVTHITDSPSSQLASSGWSNTSDTQNGATNGYGLSTTLSRTDSTRPKHALAPAVPGQSSVSLNGSFPFAPSAGSSADIYASSRTGAYPSSGPPSVESSSNEGSSTRPEVNLIPSASSGDVQLRSPPSSMIATNNTSSSSSMLEVQPVSSSVNLGRSTLTSSTMSSFQSGSGLVASSTSATSPMPVYSNGTLKLQRSMTSRYDDTPYDVYRQAAGSSRIDRVVECNQLDHVIDDIKRQLALHEGYESEQDYDEEEEDRFVDLALLSHVAMRLRDKVPCGTHVKGGIPYQHAFAGRYIVSTIQAQI
ncbi:TUS1_3 [Sanghuangporus sanghuang]